MQVAATADDLLEALETPRVQADKAPKACTTMLCSCLMAPRLCMHARIWPSLVMAGE